MQIGIQPDILILRTERPISDDIKRKIALFCNVEFGAVIESPDVRTIYEIPLRFHEQGLDEKVAAEARPRAARAGARRAGASSCSACSCRTSACASRSSASTPTTPTATRACRKRSSTAASPTTSASTSSGCRATTSRDAERAAQILAQRRRTARARRLRRARRRRHGRSDSPRARDRPAVLRHLPRHADGDHRVRAQRLRARRQPFVRVRAGVRQSRHLAHGVAAARHRHGRHDAPRRVSVPAGARLARRGDLRPARGERAPSPSVRSLEQVPRPVRRSTA